jgi:hypothetical protein
MPRDELGALVCPIWQAEGFAPQRWEEDGWATETSLFWGGFAFYLFNDDEIAVV